MTAERFLTSEWVIQKNNNLTAVRTFAHLKPGILEDVDIITLATRTPFKVSVKKD